ncbi:MULTISPECIES: hypothetical protein [Streptomyces]|uniref:Secreted protein n=1 Tax=Streptomyces solicathayae TaxID=3081768 RepID=A0ABZ0M153_9ACTN|nr:hypothetical protein [Streptomyces sp. HUAS YS2]WOX25176.1 hypothetical protein R2D22_28855 [Streptomyces sp. HUAS YS2]
MSARTHTSTRTPAAGVDTRLPWWALALPVAAFVALFLLIADPGQAHAAAGSGDPAVGRFLESLQHTLSR